MKSALLFLGFLAASIVSAAEAPSSEIGPLLDAYSAIWNKHEGVALSALFTADADLIMGNQPLVSGRKEIGEWWNMYFSRLDEGRKGGFELLSQRVIAPGVLLVNVGSKTFGANEQGEDLETRLARGTWVVVERNGDWLIAAMRGLPAQGERRVAPGTDR